jgi:hypothetical protein
VLIEAANTDDDTLRGAILGWIRIMKRHYPDQDWTGAVKIFLPACESGPTMLRSAALRGLSEIGAPASDVRDVLQAAVEDEDPWVKTAVAISLMRLAPRSDGWRPVLEAALRPEPDRPGPYPLAREILDHFDARGITRDPLREMALRTYRRALEGATSRNRNPAAEYFLKLHPEIADVAPSLVEALTATTRRSRRKAIAALCELDPEARALAQVFFKAIYLTRTRESRARFLRQSPDRELLEARLEKAIREDFDLVRRFATEALAEVRACEE